LKSYLLLRNNKSSGPYSYEELLCLPLKPQDLVWVDRKSTQWRYPSEIDEFKTVSGLGPLPVALVAIKEKPVKIVSKVFLPSQFPAEQECNILPTMAAYIPYQILMVESGLIPSRQLNNSGSQDNFSFAGADTGRLFVRFPEGIIEQGKVVVGIGTGWVRKREQLSYKKASLTGKKPPLQPIIPEFRRNDDSSDFGDTTPVSSERRIVIEFMPEDDDLAFS
jgi:hypothetical protein